MPRQSERQHLLISFDRILRQLAMNDEEESEDFDEILELFMLLRSTRFMYSKQPRLKNTSMRKMLFHWHEAAFRQEIRMTKPSFVRLIELLEDNPIFLNRSRNRQTPCWLQVMIVLNFWGCDGNGSSIGRNARKSGFSEGSMTKFKGRVISALIDVNQAHKIVTWPDEAERKVISRTFALKGQPNCVGIVDGTYVMLSQRPHLDGEVYWCRKCCYAFNVQLVCDDQKYIRFYQLGYPASLYDSTVIGESRIGQQPNRYFSDGQYIMADAGYAVSWYLCAPFKQPAASIPVNKIFNDLYSENRTTIEQVNGSLKSRFCSLRGIRTQIKQKRDVETINKQILACIILHNLMTKYQDDAQFEINEDDVVNENDHVEIQAAEYANGNDLRHAVKIQLLQWGQDNNKY